MREGTTLMSTTQDTKAKRLITALGLAAAGAVTPALLFVGAGTAHADDPCYGDLQYSFYCSPGSSALDPAPAAEPGSPYYTPLPNPYSILPGCTGGVLEALDGSCG
jgi:hypothetical protein